MCVEKEVYASPKIHVRLHASQKIQVRLSTSLQVQVRHGRFWCFCQRHAETKAPKAPPYPDLQPVTAPVLPRQSQQENNNFASLSEMKSERSGRNIWQRLFLPMTPLAAPTGGLTTSREPDEEALVLPKLEGDRGKVDLRTGKRPSYINDPVKGVRMYVG